MADTKTLEISQETVIKFVGIVKNLFIQENVSEEDKELSKAEVIRLFAINQEDPNESKVLIDSLNELVDTAASKQITGATANPTTPDEYKS